MDLPDAVWAYQQEMVDGAVRRGLDAGFTRSMRPNRPWVEGLLLICPGGVVGSWAGHRCWFVSVDGKWCFEHNSMLADVVERRQNGMRSVTVLEAVDGSLVEAVMARSRGGAHTLVEAVGWRVDNATLVPIGKRHGGRYDLPACDRA